MLSDDERQALRESLNGTFARLLVTPIVLESLPSEATFMLMPIHLRARTSDSEGRAKN